MKRCAWAANDPMIRYHDEEWGVPVHDDRALFESLILGGAQAGLSWETILRKRENYRAAFDRFDAAAIARYDRRKVEVLLADPGIVRNRLKIAAAITNAKAFLAIQEEFGSFDAYIWGWVDGQTQDERVAFAFGGPHPNAGIRRHERGPQAPRVQVRGFDHLLRLHAGGRDDQRPHH